MVKAPLAAGLRAAPPVRPRVVGAQEPVPVEAPLAAGLRAAAQVHPEVVGAQEAVVVGARVARAQAATQVRPEAPELREAVAAQVQAVDKRARARGLGAETAVILRTGCFRQGLQPPRSFCRPGP
ncbi:MAG: hypothetical protein JO122_08970 [Acetobacteraceae bacterium]|nr:hypothetical protein [Acetobacteraceae bacterium]